LLRVALYCVPGGVRVVSIEVHSCFTILLARVTHPKLVQHLLGHAKHTAYPRPLLALDT
jgi:hypothetical protein